MRKPTVAIVSLTSCEGCQFAILDLGNKFLNLLKKINLVEFRLIEELKLPKKFDISFVEGNPVTKEDIKLLKEVHKESKILVALGNCAAMGGVWEMKNYHDKKKTLRYIYKNIKKVPNPEIKEIDNFVKVDFTLPGCPIDGDEFLRITYDLVEGRPLKILSNPVCYECQLQGYDCLLQKGKICLGPIILAGCRAVCLEGGLSCFGCRGLLKNTPKEAIKNLLHELEKTHTKEEIKMAMEIFGVRDEIEEKVKVKN